MNQQFLTITEKDNDNQPASIISFNKTFIIAAAFSVTEGSMAVTISDSFSKTSKLYEPILNKEGKHNGAYRESFGTEIKNKTIVVRDKSNIVAIHNFLNNDTATVDSYEGFKLYEAEQERIKQALEQKAKEEAKINPNEPGVKNTTSQES